jgi:hypothetical protein
MRKAIALSIALFANVAHADWFYHDDNIEITLLNEPCSMAFPMAQKAFAQPLDHNGLANGCWWLGSDKTYVIVLDIGANQHYEYMLYRSKFQLIEE